MERIFKGKELQKAFASVRKLRIINEVLAAAYGTPTLGNVKKIIDEIVYLTIAQRTRLETAKTVFSDLKAEVGNWENFVKHPEKYSEILSRAGRGEERRKIILKVLTKAKEIDSTLEFEFLKQMKPRKVNDFLVNDLGLGEKITSCVMIYCLDMDSFPVDSNIIRVFSKLGFTNQLLGELDPNDHRKFQSVALERIPKDIGARLHVNLVVHGKRVCTASPECRICPIRKFCYYYLDEYSKREEK